VNRLLIPERLRHLLADSPVEAPTLRYADEATIVLRDNKTPFFPAYTDHGTEHVERVLTAIDLLIPDDVWSSRLLRPTDAAVLVCASILHDIAMHIREVNFLALIRDPSEFEPLPWFSAPHGPRPGDEPWHALWRAFQREARHFGRTQVDRLLGPNPERAVSVRL
jgi:molecular chaperone HtpG